MWVMALRSLPGHFRLYFADLWGPSLTSGSLSFILCQFTTPFAHFRVTSGSLPIHEALRSFLCHFRVYFADSRGPYLTSLSLPGHSDSRGPSLTSGSPSSPSVLLFSLLIHNMVVVLMLFMNASALLRNRMLNITSTLRFPVNFYDYTYTFKEVFVFLLVFFFLIFRRSSFAPSLLFRLLLLHTHRKF